MGMLFAAECDVCGVRQIKKNAHELEGSTYMENTVQKFICTQCKSLMKASFEIKKGGLRKPLSKVAGLVEERDKALRERDEALAALAGENPFAAVTVGNPKAALQPPVRPGQPVPLVNQGPPKEGDVQRLEHDKDKDDRRKKWKKDKDPRDSK